MPLGGSIDAIVRYLRDEYNNTPSIFWKVLFGIGFIIGALSTPYQHVGAHPIIFEILPLIAGFNVILSFMTALGFMVGDLLTRPIYGPGYPGAPPWWGYIFIHIGVLIYAILPAITIRLALRYFYKRFLFDGGPVNMGRDVIVRAVGAAVGVLAGYGVLYAAASATYLGSPVIVGRSPDYGCMDIEVTHDLMNLGKVATGVLFTGPLGGVVNFLKDSGLIPSESSLYTRLTGKEYKPKGGIALPKEVKGISKKLSETKLKKGIKSIEKVVKKTKAKLPKAVETKEVAEKAVTPGELESWSYFDYSMFENISSLVGSSIDEISNFISEVSEFIQKGLSFKLKRTVSKLTKLKYRYDQALDEAMLAAEEYKGVVKKLKLRGSKVVKPKEYVEKMLRYRKAVNELNKLKAEVRSVSKEVSSIRKALAKEKAFVGRWKIASTGMNIVNHGLLCYDIYTDYVSFRDLDHASRIDDAAKSVAGNLVSYVIGNKYPFSLPIYEITNTIAFDGSEAAKIISASSMIKGVTHYMYDLVTKGVDHVTKAASEGKYGSLVKNIHDLGVELSEYLKDPELVYEVFDNKGWTAGLKGVEDNLGKFMDGIHESIDKVFKVSKDSWWITKKVSAGAKMIAHGWANLTEATIRAVTSIFGG